MGHYKTSLIGDLKWAGHEANEEWNRYRDTTKAIERIQTLAALLAGAIDPSFPLYATDIFEEIRKRENLSRIITPEIELLIQGQRRTISEALSNGITESDMQTVEDKILKLQDDKVLFTLDELISILGVSPASIRRLKGLLTRLVNRKKLLLIDKTRFLIAGNKAPEKVDSAATNEGTESEESVCKPKVEYEIENLDDIIERERKEDAIIQALCSSYCEDGYTPTNPTLCEELKDKGYLTSQDGKYRITDKKHPLDVVEQCRNLFDKIAQNYASAQTQVNMIAGESIYKRYGEIMPAEIMKRIVEETIDRIQAKRESIANRGLKDKNTTQIIIKLNFPKWYEE